MANIITCAIETAAEGGHRPMPAATRYGRNKRVPRLHTANGYRIQRPRPQIRYASIACPERRQPQRWLASRQPSEPHQRLPGERALWSAWRVRRALCSV